MSKKFRWRGMVSICIYVDVKSVTVSNIGIYYTYTHVCKYIFS